MNPDQTLIEIRRLVESHDESKWYELRDKWRELDDYLCQYGDLPADWNRGPKRIMFSPEALAILTEKQRDRLVGMAAGGENEVRVIKPASWDLSEGWLSFLLRYNGKGPGIEGGISPEGDAHS